jgi:hypothetical protein
MADGFPPMGASAPYTVTDEDRAAIAAAISQDEIVELALTLGNIPGSLGQGARGRQLRLRLDGA